mmetsp:Transcript_65921/g.175558  ORF Transcript_65921/g.175558 Transcript_65921/m.175558 type:complete len:205 (-) Transcript_65921:1965-2579(-)
MRRTRDSTPPAMQALHTRSSRRVRERTAHPAICRGKPCNDLKTEAERGESSCSLGAVVQDVLDLPLDLLLESAANLLQGRFPDACQCGKYVLVDLCARELRLVDLCEDRHDLWQLLGRCDRGMALRHQSQQLRTRPLAGLLVVLQRQVGEPHAPDLAGVLAQRCCVVLADVAQRADSCIHCEGRLLGLSLDRLPSPVALAILLQ